MKNIAKSIRKIGNFFKKNGATILTISGAVSTATSVGLTVYETVKAVEKVNSLEDITILGVAKAVAPNYIPVLGLTAFSIFCTLKSNSLNKKIQASLTSAYILGDQYRKKYRQKVAEKYGEDAEKEIQKETQEEICKIYKEDPICHAFDCTPDKLFTFYDPFLNKEYQRYEREMIDAEYHINRNLVQGLVLSLNDVRKFFKLPPVTPENSSVDGDDLCYSIEDGYYWIDFYHVPILDRPGVYSVEMSYDPYPSYFAYEMGGLKSYIGYPVDEEPVPSYCEMP